MGAVGIRKQTLFVIFSVVVISLFVIGMSYSTISNIGSVSNNTVVTNYPVTATFKESNIIEGDLQVLSNEAGLESSSKAFSVLNESDNNVSYSVYIKLLDSNLIDPSNLVISIDGEDPKTLDLFTESDKGYNVLTNILKFKNDASDVSTHNLRVWAKGGEVTYACLELNVFGEKTYDILADKIYTLSRSEGNNLFVDSFGNARFYGSEADNYVKYNDEVWRIIGAFSVTNENGRVESRVKLIKEDSIGISPLISSSNYSWNVNMGLILSDYIHNKENEVLTSYLSDNSTKLFKSAGFNFGSIEYKDNISATDFYDNETSATDYFGRNTSSNMEIGLLTISDYLFASKDNTTTNYLNNGSDYWLLNNDAKNTNKAFYVGEDGDIRSDDVSNTHSIRPVIYLKSTVISKEGDGSIENPYVIK